MYNEYLVSVSILSVKHFLMLVLYLMSILGCFDAEFNTYKMVLLAS
ncbi:hypothetical protein PROVRETT_06962 [Providencia rettgeri DSM 1131]|nr:hypothetical protein PROVRETT_06962 [Providencia rettgeri DSM 1131]